MLGAYASQVAISPATDKVVLSLLRALAEDYVAEDHTMLSESGILKVKSCGAPFFPRVRCVSLQLTRRVFRPAVCDYKRV